jgi:hypothetical protein
MGVYEGVGDPWGRILNIDGSTVRGQGQGAIQRVLGENRSAESIRS